MIRCGVIIDVKNYKENIQSFSKGVNAFDTSLFLHFNSHWWSCLLKFNDAKWVCLTSGNHYVSSIINRKFLKCSDWGVTFWSNVKDDRMSILLSVNNNIVNELLQFILKNYILWNVYHALNAEQLMSRSPCFFICQKLAMWTLLLHCVRKPQPLKWEHWWLQGYFWTLLWHSNGQS